MRLFDRFPARYLAPNGVTCIGLVLGLLSIRTSLGATTLAAARGGRVADPLRGAARQG
jgi:phosphatidylserine synthase